MIELSTSVLVVPTSDFTPGADHARTIQDLLTVPLPIDWTFQFAASFRGKVAIILRQSIKFLPAIGDCQLSITGSKHRLA